MESEVHWLLHYCLDRKLLSQEQVQAMVSSLPATTTVHECAEQMIRSGWVNDAEFLESAVNSAIENAKNGFEPTEDNGLKSELVGADKFQDFSQLGQLSDEELLEVVTDIFSQCKQLGASDLHITGGARPRIRKQRQITYLSNNSMDDSIARRINLLLLNPAQRKQFEETLDLDYALALTNQKDGSEMRFRVNLMEHARGISGVYRIVNDRLMSLEKLGFQNPETIRRLLDYHNGIILVTGPVGSGKTTTLATLVDELNKKRKDHIIAIEDPIEVVQHSASSIITQREIGQHTHSFHAALKSALREDPDIIVIGEMRDLTTIEMAITAAETGHLVIATMHTRDAKSTLNRILDVFPPGQQNQIRAMTAGSLRGIICQKQLPDLDGGVVLACETLVNTNAVANIIRDGKETGLENAMQSGKRFGMQTMDDSIKDLFKKGKLSQEIAEINSTHSSGKNG